MVHFKRHQWIPRKAKKAEVCGNGKWWVSLLSLFCLPSERLSLVMLASLVTILRNIAHRRLQPRRPWGLVQQRWEACPTGDSVCSVLLSPDPSLGGFECAYCPCQIKAKMHLTLASEVSNKAVALLNGS